MEVKKVYRYSESIVLLLKDSLILRHLRSHDRPIERDLILEQIELRACVDGRLRLLGSGQLLKRGYIMDSSHVGYSDGRPQK